MEQLDPAGLLKYVSWPFPSLAVSFGCLYDFEPRSLQSVLPYCGHNCWGELSEVVVCVIGGGLWQIQVLAERKWDVAAVSVEDLEWNSSTSGYGAFFSALFSSNGNWKLRPLQSHSHLHSFEMLSFKIRCTFCSLHLTSCRIWKLKTCNECERGLAKPEIHGACSFFFLPNCGAYMNTLFTIKVKSLVLMNGHRCPPNYVDYWSSKINLFWVGNPISF